MALPKRKTSKARRDKRRAHWKLTSPTLTRCANSQCRKPCLPHAACPYCGYYNGREVYLTKQRKEQD